MITATPQEIVLFEALGWQYVAPASNGLIHATFMAGRGETVRRLVAACEGATWSRDGWMASSRQGWSSPIFDDPWTAYTFAEVEGWGEGQRVPITDGWLYLDNGTDWVATNKQVSLYAGPNQIVVDMLQTMRVCGARVNDYKVQLAFPTFAQAGDALILDWEVTLG